MHAMTGTNSNSGNSGSPRVDQARKIVAKRRSDSRSRGMGGGGGGDNGKEQRRAASSTTANDYTSLNPFQCLDASATATAGAGGVKMIRGSYSPPKSRGGSNYNNRSSRDRSRGPPAIQYADSMTSEATPVHANKYGHGHRDRYNDSDDSGSYADGSARGNHYNEYNESGVEYAADHYDVDNDNYNDNADNADNDADVNARERNVMHSLLPNHSLVDDSSTFADETTTAPGSPRSYGHGGGGGNGKTGGNGYANGHANGHANGGGGGGGGTSKSSHSNNSGSGGNNSGSGTNSSGSKEAYTRIMHQYLVQSQTNPLTKRAAASVIVEAAATTTATGVNTTSTTTKTTKTTTRTVTTTNVGHRGQDRPSPSPPRPPLPPLDPSSSQNPTNSRLRSLLSSGLASTNANTCKTNTSKDHSKDNHNDGGGDDATTEDMTNSYPISNDGASTISSLSSGSGRRAAYRSLVHFLPSLLPMPPPPPPPQSTPPPSQQHSDQVAAATGNSLHDLNVSGISYQSSQTGGTARSRSLPGSGDGNRPTPVRSGSRPRDQVGVDPDGPLMGRRATVRGGDEEEDASNNGNARGITSRRPQYNNHRYDDSDDSETLGSLVTAEGEDGDNHTHADSAAAGFYPVGQMQTQQQQQQAYQRQGQAQKRSDDSVGSNNVARDILSKYGQGKSGGNNATKPTEGASSDPPVDASPPPRPSPNGTRHSASLRMKARSRSPANRRSHPQSSPTASKSESPPVRGGQSEDTDPDPVPASSNPSSSTNNNTPPDRRVGGKKGGIAARIAMFEKNNAGTPPSTPPKPQPTTKRWTPPNDIPNPRVQPGAPSPASKEAMSSSIDGDESMAGASVTSRASSIPFDEKIDRGMRAAASTLSTTAPIPEQTELTHEDDEWRERMIMGQRHVAPKGVTASTGTSNSAEPSDQSRSVSPRKPNWQSAGRSPPDRSPPTTPSGQETLSEAQPQNEAETNEEVLQNRGARAARLARHRQRSLSPQKAEIKAQAELSDARTNNAEQITGPTTKSIFSPPVSGNRVRWSTSFEDASDEGIADDTDEVMMREIDEAMMAHQRSDPRDMNQNSNQIYEEEQSPGTGNSRSRAHAALQSRRRNQTRQSQETQQAPPVVSSSTMPLHQPHMPVGTFSNAPEDEEDELDLAESFPPGGPSASGGRLGIETTNYGRGHEIDHTAGSDFDNDNGADTFSETMHSDIFDVDVRPHDFGSEDDEDVNGMDDIPQANVNSMPQSRQTLPNRSSSTAFVISINDLELFGARELSLASAPAIEPAINSEGLVTTAFRDAVRAEEARLLRQRCVDFVSYRRESGHDSEQIGGNPFIHLDDILADVVIIQEIALDKLELGDYDGAMSSFMSIVTKCEDGTYTFADERVQDELTGTIMHNIAVIHMQLGIFDITPQLWDEACMTRRDSNPELGIFQHSVATSLNEMGVSLFACGNFEKAIQAFADTIYVRQEIHSMDNAPLAQAINNIGVVHFAMESIDQSLEAFDEALQVYRLAMLAENDEGNVSHDESDLADGSGAQTLLLGIATTLSNVAYAKATQGAYAEAREALGEAIEIQEAVLESNNPRIETSLALMESLDNVAGRSTATCSIAPQALSAAFDPFDSMEV